MNNSPRQQLHSTATKNQANHRKSANPQQNRLLLQRAQATPGSLRPGDVLQLQRTIGNRATGRLLANRLPIQAKMEVGPVNDKHEQEADRVAKEVVRRSSAPPSLLTNRMGVQRVPLADQIAGVQRVEEDELEMKRDDIQRVEEDELEMKRDDIQRVEEDELEMKREDVQRVEEDELEMKREDVQRVEEDELEMKRESDPSYQEGGALENDIEQSIRRAKGGGQSMSSAVMRQMESGFGATFGGVRIHTDAAADKLTRSVQAKAFTTGRDIFFKRGEYNPGSGAGKELLAHELTHTVQQGAASIQQISKTSGLRNG